MRAGAVGSLLLVEAGGGHCSGTSGFAQAVDDTLAFRGRGGVVVARRASAKLEEGERRLEGQPRLGRGARLFRRAR